MNVQALEQARVEAARKVIGRFLPLMEKLYSRWMVGKIETTDGCFIKPVREAMIYVGADIGKDHEGRKFIYGRFVGMHDILEAFLQGSRLHEAMELLTATMMGVINTDSAVWIDAQADEIDDIVEMIEKVISGDNPQCKEAA